MPGRVSSEQVSAGLASTLAGPVRLGRIVPRLRSVGPSPGFCIGCRVQKLSIPSSLHGVFGAFQVGFRSISSRVVQPLGVIASQGKRVPLHVEGGGFTLQPDRSVEQFATAEPLQIKCCHGIGALVPTKTNALNKCSMMLDVPQEECVLILEPSKEPRACPHQDSGPDLGLDAYLSTLHIQSSLKEPS